VGFLAISADSSVSRIGVSNVGFHKQLSLPVFTVHSPPCCFCVHSPRGPIQFPCPLSTHPHAASISTAHAVPYSFHVHSPLTPMLLLSPLLTQSHAISLSTTHLVSCCFCAHCPLSLVLFLRLLLTRSRAISVSTVPPCLRNAAL
jgi:hypothetical protein